MNYILFDGEVRNSLLPFTYTRPVAEIRIGILTLREKWEKHLGLTTTTITEEYLEEKYPMVELEENIMINASFIPTVALVAQVKKLKVNEAIFKGDDVIAFFTTDSQEEINFEDFDLITEDRTSQPIPEGVQAINPENIFIEEGAKLTFATLNATDGPIYIGENAEIMEGVVVRGALAMCENSVLKLGAKVYGASTIGPFCKVGGEVNNSVLFGYSSKGHDGFLGNSVIGEWCNLGADTNNSNLKNNYAAVKLWDYNTGRFAKTGLQFCGLMMGDHSKCGINTMFNTGTVIGVSVNIFGSGFPRNFVPSFSWGGASGFTEYKTNKVFEVAEVVMQRRGITFDVKEQAILEHVFEATSQYRNY